MAALVKAAKSGKSADLAAALDLIGATTRRKLDRRFNEAGLTDCAINRRS